MQVEYFSNNKINNHFTTINYHNYIFIYTNEIQDKIVENGKHLVFRHPKNH